MIKSSYKVDLRGLHALCEANYARLLRIFPDYESCNGSRFSLGSVQIHIEVLERCRYTTMFRLCSYRATADAAQREVSEEAGGSGGSDLAWLSPLKLEARAYHDAGMLEVVGFQSAGRVDGRYSYPNPRMHQQDEKHQQNAFLAEWLSHCLHHGEAELSWRLKPGAEHA